jgi:hypothetical protein
MEKKIIELDVKVKGENNVKAVDNNIKKAEGSAKNLKKETGGITQQLDKLSGGAISGFRNMTKGVKGVTLGFKGLRGAIIATGIGALLIAVTSLAMAFRRNQDEADKLSEFMSGIGAAVDILLDGLADLGSLLINVFSNPKQAVKDLWEVIKQNLVNRIQGVVDAFGAVGRAIQSVINLDWDGLKEAGKDFALANQQIVTGVTAEQWSKLGENIKNTGNEIAIAAEKARRLQRAENALRDATIRNIGTQAELRKVIESKRLQAEAEGISISEQIKLLQEADDAEQALLSNRQKLLKQEISILQQRQALSKNTAEDNRQLAELQASLIDLESQSASQRVRLSRRLNSLRKQEQAEEEEYYKQLEQLRLNALTDAEEKLRQETEIKLREIREKYGRETELEKELIAQRDAEIDRLRIEKEQKDEEAEEKRLAGIKAIQDEFAELTELERLDKEEAAKLAELERLNATEDEKLAIIEAFENKRNKLAKDSADFQKELDRQLLQSKLQAFSNILGATAVAFGEQSKLGKKFAIAQALFNTYQGVSGALADPTTPSFFVRLANASTALATGLNAVRQIRKTNFSGGGATGGAQAVQTTQAQSPRFNINEAAQGNQIADALSEQSNRPIEAYVVSSNVRSREALDRNIEESATIG